MKKVLSKFKKYSFWVAFTGVVVIFIKNLAELIGFTVDTGVIENVIMSLCGVLVVLGLVSKDYQVDKQKDSVNNVEKEKTGLDEVPEIQNTIQDNTEDVDKTK